MRALSWPVPASSSSMSRLAQLDAADEIKRLFVRIRELQAQGVTVSVHLASPAGGLRNLPGGDGAARREAYRLRGGRRSAEGSADRSAMTGENVHLAVDAGAAGLWRRTRLLRPTCAPCRRTGGEDFNDISFTVRRGEVPSASPEPAVAGPHRRRGGGGGPGALTTGVRSGSMKGPCAQATFRRRSRSGSAASPRAGTGRAWSSPSRSPTIRP